MFVFTNLAFNDCFGTHLLTRISTIITGDTPLLAQSESWIRGYQPNIATFRADQFDERNPREKPSKAAFFIYFYLALNLGSFFSNTVLDYFVDGGMWDLGFWAAAGSAFTGLALFLGGTAKYSHFRFLDRATLLTSKELDNEK
ncbi:Protein NRT1/ PTR FAMILY 7.3 [Capsicum baccatum]|uniref:Protein NRT1/ PTR FAMILY 7.3 n=1 Tax=Capsicum baccatum TaxID=33114 RepID=A0A2G2XCN8_CAPBA|nr:Protein NRT1/ PTR FAMILY 7.3 [Capsicum baccatum]